MLVCVVGGSRVAPMTQEREKYGLSLSGTSPSKRAPRNECSNSSLLVGAASLASPGSTLMRNSGVPKSVRKCSMYCAPGYQFSGEMRVAFRLFMEEIEALLFVMKTSVDSSGLVGNQFGWKWNQESNKTLLIRLKESNCQLN